VAWLSSDLEELEQGASVGGDHLQQHVKLLALRGLAVGRAEGKGQEVQQGADDQSTGTMVLKDKRQRQSRVRDIDRD